VRFRRSIHPRVAIDIAPLVDVVFLLVIFFAVSTTFLETSGMKLELPESSSSTEREVREIAVFLAPDGKLVFDDEPVSREELGARLREALDKADRKMVVLRADGGTPHAKVVEVIDLIKEAGAEGLTVATRSKVE